jgi:mannose-6-phosphate isomerase-like protein (cupin superfamily)
MRRVVLGNGSAGLGRVLADGVPPTVHTAKTLGLAEGSEWDELWISRGVTLSTVDETMDVQGFFMPGPGIVSFKAGVFPPMRTAEIMHSTDTIDYLTIVSGSIDVEMDGGEARTLESGDTAVQLGGRHRWFNRGGVPCVMTIVMVGVERR